MANCISFRRNEDLTAFQKESYQYCISENKTLMSWQIELNFYNQLILFVISITSLHYKIFRNL